VTGTGPVGRRSLAFRGRVVAPVTLLLADIALVVLGLVAGAFAHPRRSVDMALVTASAAVGVLVLLAVVAAAIRSARAGTGTRVGPGTGRPGPAGTGVWLALLRLVAFVVAVATVVAVTDPQADGTWAVRTSAVALGLLDALAAVVIALAVRRRS
jgi:hypothetical protein